MPYPEGSAQERLLAGDRAILDQVRRWIADVLTSPRFWRLRSEWRDLQQEVLIRLFESLRRERFRADGELKGYVQGICRHAAQDRLADRPAGQEFDEALPGGRAGGRDSESRLIADQLMRRALDDSSDPCREMIRAYFVQGMTYAEMADRMKVPVGTVKSRLFRCLQCLRDSMGQAQPRAPRRERVPE